MLGGMVASLWGLVTSISLLQWALLLVLLAITIHYFVMAPFKKFSNIPQLQPHWFWGNQPFLTKSHTEIIHEFYKEMKHHKFCIFWEGNQPCVFLSDLELIKRVMVTDFEHFNNLGFVPQEYKEKVGLVFGLADATGEEWKTLKRLLTPAFSGPKVKKSALAMNECAEKMTSFLTEAVDKKKDISLENEILNFAMTTIGAVAFGIDINCFKDPDNDFMKKGKNMLQMWRFFLMNMFPKLMIWLKIGIINPDSEKFFVKLAESLLKQRKNSKDEHHDIMHSLIKASEVAPELMTPKMMFLTITQFFTDGFSTFGEIVSGMLYLIAVHPEVQTKLQEELDEVLEDKTKVTEEDVRNLPYLDQVMSECLRRAPIPLTNRLCMQDYRLPGTDFVVPKGMKVIIPVSGVQLDPSYWPNPEEFDPERFSSEIRSKHVPGSYLPFGMGPRQCIGYNLTKMEAKVMICHLLRKFRLVPADDLPQKYQFDKNGFAKPVGMEKIKIAKR